MSAPVVPIRQLLDDPKHLVAANVRAELARLGYQQTEVAQALGITQAAVSLKLKGQRPLSVEDLFVIADLVGVEPGDLLARRSPRPAGPAGASASLSQRARPEGLEPPTFCSVSPDTLTSGDTLAPVIRLPVRDHLDDDGNDDGDLASVTLLPTAVAWPELEALFS